MAGFHIEHFGCRAARADGEALAHRLRGQGLAEAQAEAADLVVVNTCSVTAEADRAARAFIRRAHRRNPAAKIVVTGCYAQRAPAEIAEISGVAAVVGNSHKALASRIALDLIQIAPTAAPPQVACDCSDTSAAQAVAAPPQVDRDRSNTPAAQAASAPPQVVVWADERFAHSFIEELPLASGRQTRPSFKIQEGCGNHCSFCVIPQTRGPSQSLPAAAVLRQVEKFVAAGGNELVLSGINLGRWGRDLQPGPGEPARLSELARAIIERTALPRLRLSSVEPMDWDGDLLALLRQYGGTRLARHAHLPLQSGSDAVLRRMHRRYRPWHYAEKLSSLLAAAGPALTLGADVMVGFPGETDREFEETLEFLRALPFGYLHLFPFSPRPRTRAWALHAIAPVALAAVEERMAALRALAAEKLRVHRLQFAGDALPAITLRTPPALAARKRTAAVTENNLPVELDGNLPANQMIEVAVRGLTPENALEAALR
jgi:threonylcarbamoyladenosine tRNA methylthiotransferase MtaB